MVRGRYGLDGVDSKTLDHIGREMGLSRERVRQVESKALTKLRQPYRNYRVREHELGQLYVEKGVREPASEAVAAARALIAEAEAEGLELQQQPQQQLAVAAGVAQPVLAAAGDRPLKIEFKPGVDASESTQAVEAVLVAALDRAPTAAAAAAATAAAAAEGRRRSRDGGGVEPRATDRRRESMAEKSQPLQQRQQKQQPGEVLIKQPVIELGRAGAAAVAAVASTASDGLASAEEGQRVVVEPPTLERSGSRLGGEVILPPDSPRVLMDVAESEQNQGAVQPESLDLDANGLQQGVVGLGVERLAELDSAERNQNSVTAGGADSSSSSSSSASSEAFSLEPPPLVLGVDGVVGLQQQQQQQPAVVVPTTLAAEEEQRAREIESKRKSLDKAWNKKSVAAVDRLERELAQSAAALAMLEMEQEEWEKCVGESVEQKSLSMASR